MIEVILRMIEKKQLIAVAAGSLKDLAQRHRFQRSLKETSLFVRIKIITSHPT